MNRPAAIQKCDQLAKENPHEQYYVVKIAGGHQAIDFCAFMEMRRYHPSLRPEYAAYYTPGSMIEWTPTQTEET